ncbi:hypothetical protein FA95DRAFT_1574733 [Auriscalpium vulgare]|uniref:Uncharacterized protein n=1 Tax=Auriscalpium vulgare TaxID=40419 RepID=A0ACB8RIV5_9AGAM|nr:hypothetical protein FA95DRAFT_1574733 [Auriscalpium vulgare]
MPEIAPVSYKHIPGELIGPFFPPLSLSISGLLRFNLAPFPVASDVDIPILSKDAPSTALTSAVLRAIQPPTVTALQDLLNGRLVKFATSVKISGASLPIEVVDVWATLMHVHRVRNSWESALRWMKGRGKRSGGHKDLCEGIHRSLRAAAWGDAVLGFDGADPVTSLAVYTSDAWLSDVHLAQMSTLISNQLYDDGKQDGVLIVGPLASKTIIDDHLRDTSHPWVAQLGKDLQEGRTKLVLGTALINNNHWISYAVDAQRQAIFIGDSLSNILPASVTHGLLSWVKRSTAADYGTDLFPCGVQTDGFSCGMFAINSLEHRISPAKVPLLDSASSITMARLRMLAQVLDIHLMTVWWLACRRLYRRLTNKQASANAMHGDSVRELEAEDDREGVPMIADSPKSAAGLEASELPTSPESGMEQFPDNNGTSIRTSEPPSEPGDLDEPSSPCVEPIDDARSSQSAESSEGDSGVPPHRRSPSLDGGELGITSFFWRIPRAQWLAQEVEASRKRRKEEEATREEREHDKQLAAQRKLAHVRGLANVRQKKHREKKKDEEIEAGLRDSDGKKVKKQMVGRMRT